MINIVEDLVQSFEELNNFLDKKLLSKQLLLEAHGNIRDFKQEKEDMMKFLYEIDNNSGNVEALDLSLLHLHLEVSAMGDRLDNVRELIELIMGRYRKLVREQGYAKD